MSSLLTNTTTTCVHVLDDPCGRGVLNVSLHRYREEYQGFLGSHIFSHHVLDYLHQISIGNLKGWLTKEVDV